MEYFAYSDWITWPETAIDEYAREIADCHNLTKVQADHLAHQMKLQAGHWPKIEERFGPRKMSSETEELFRSLGNGHDEVHKQNVRLNAPSIARKDHTEIRWETVGSGLTSRRKRKVIRESAAYRKESVRARKMYARRPFSAMNLEIRRLSEDAMWVAGCFPIDPATWLIPVDADDDEPHEGLIWYSDELLRAYHNARDQASTGNSEAAMWHAFRAGALSAELGIRMAHGMNRPGFAGGHFI